MKPKPKTKAEQFKNLSPSARKIIINCIRNYILDMEIHKQNGLGLEATEEIFISLIDKGLIKIVVDECGVYWLEEWCPELDRFLPVNY